MSNFHRNLPRLDPEKYRGHVHVHFTSSTHRRRKLFTSEKRVNPLVEMLRKRLAEGFCECVVYVFMPDHVHMLLHGATDDSDLLECHNGWKGESGKRLCSELGIGTAWQHRPYDRILRSHQYERGALRDVIRYILENPVRAGIVDKWEDYLFLGSLIGPCDIREDGWWEWFYG
jgi:putative transposase